MGAVVATRAVAKSMEYDGTFYSTYGWHPLSVEVTIANNRRISRGGAGGVLTRGRRGAEKILCVFFLGVLSASA